MKNRTLSLSIVLGVVLIQGCAHGKLDRELDAKLADEPPVKSRSTLRIDADQLIRTAPGLSGKQRDDLAKNRVSARAESERLRLRSLELRSALIKDLLSTNYNSQEVDLIKREIREVEQQRLARFFRTVLDTNEILRRWGSRDQREGEQFLDEVMQENGRD